MTNRQQRRQRRFLVETDDTGTTHVLEGLGTQFLDGQSLQSKFAGIDLDAVPKGEHLWVMMCAFRYDPTRTGPAILDLENLLQVGGIGCFVCEQPHTFDIAMLPCPGDPS